MDIKVRGYRLVGDENNIKIEVDSVKTKKWVKAKIIGFHPCFIRLKTEEGYTVSMSYHDAKTQMKGVKVRNE